MAAETPQTFSNHARFVPAYHFVAFPIFFLNLFWALYQMIVAPRLGTLIGVLVSIALLIVCYYARVFALRVQDRLIRLEMRLRLTELLPADLRARIPELSAKQLVALRFASDEELPELARKVLADNIQDGKTIKQMIRTWEADYLRA